MPPPQLRLASSRIQALTEALVSLHSRLHTAKVEYESWVAESDSFQPLLLQTQLRVQSRDIDRGNINRGDIDREEAGARSIFEHAEELQMRNEAAAHRIRDFEVEIVMLRMEIEQAVIMEESRIRNRDLELLARSERSQARRAQRRCQCELPAWAEM